MNFFNLLFIVFVVRFFWIFFKKKRRRYRCLDILKNVSGKKTVVI